VPLIRSEVTMTANGDIPADASVNIVYHNNTNITGILDVGWQSHADEVRDAFSGASSDDPAFTVYSSRKIQVKCYDMADAKPRPVRATSNFVPSGAWELAESLAPRQVALCLSYFAGRNLPATRGRIYIGPFVNPESVPSVTHQSMVLDLGSALFNVGGANVHWQQYSDKGNVGSTITAIWVDNRWDTQRRRLVKATSRLTHTF
jgi:hypothetical protein